MTQLCVVMVDSVAGLREQVELLKERVAELEYLWSEEFMRQNAGTATGRAVIEELGHGWRIERAPACGAGMDGAPSRRGRDGEGECGGVGVWEPEFVHSPGYAAE